MTESYTFTLPRAPASEWAGTQIGIANILTRAKDRLPEANIALDAKPGVRDRMLTHAMQALEGKESYIHDLVFNGQRVRCFSNSHHLGDFWQENGFSVADWRMLTGKAVPSEAHVTAYAVINVPGEAETSAYSRQHRQVFAFNTSWYGEIRARVLEMVGATRAAAVSVGGKGAVFLGGPGKSSVAFGLLEQPRARFLADSAVFLRAEADRLTAYAAEKRSYVRSNLVAAFPELAWAFLQSRFENAPGYLVEHGLEIDALVASALSSPDPAALSYFRSLPPAQTRSLLGRLVAYEGTRVLLDPAAAFGARCVVTHPLEPMTVHAAFALRRDTSDAVVLESVTPERFKAMTGADLGMVPLYSLNLIFDLDATNRSGREVALAASQLAARVLERTPRDARFTLANYR